MTRMTHALWRDCWGFAVHTRNIDKLGPLEWILATPSHHRVHHAINPIYDGKNYGFVMIIWDSCSARSSPSSRRSRRCSGRTGRRGRCIRSRSRFTSFASCGATRWRPAAGATSSGSGSCPRAGARPMCRRSPRGSPSRLAGAARAVPRRWPAARVSRGRVLSPVEHIVRRYRRHIASGSDPARALADAQRWWLVEGLPSLLGLLEGRSEQDAIAAFVSSLGGEGTIGDGLETLGPRRDPTKPMDASEIQRWREHLTCPVSWAGFRFVGVPDRRPQNRWTDEHAHPASEDVKREVKRLIESVPEAREGLEEWRERELNELAQRTPGSPTPEQAITAARLFRDRVTSSHTHNLLAGLAWLHEALACEPLPAEARAGLAIEAAHLWLDLATGESLHPMLSFPSIGVQARARAVVEGLVGDDPDLAAARARLAYLDAIVEARSDLAEATRRGWQVLGPNLGRPEVTHAAIRRATTACEILVADPGAVEGAAERALEHVNELLRLLPDGLRDGSLRPRVSPGRGSQCPGFPVESAHRGCRTAPRERRRTLCAMCRCIRRWPRCWPNGTCPGGPR
jgi:hypothetical protein